MGLRPASLKKRKEIIVGIVNGVCPITVGSRVVQMANDAGEI
jgi:hypothetical protein